MNISVRPFKGIRVAIPYGVSYAVAEQFARSQKEWLEKNLRRIKKFEQDCPPGPAWKTEIDRKEAAMILSERLQKIAEMHGYRYNRLTVRNQKTRWGSCSGNNNISLNVKLTLLPDELRDYIILHELVHTRVKNHSNEFWSEISRVEPRARKLANQVKQYSIQCIDNSFRPHR